MSKFSLRLSTLIFFSPEEKIEEKNLWLHFFLHVKFQDFEHEDFSLSATKIYKFPKISVSLSRGNFYSFLSEIFFQFYYVLGLQAKTFRTLAEKKSRQGFRNCLLLVLRINLRNSLGFWNEVTQKFFQFGAEKFLTFDQKFSAWCQNYFLPVLRKFFSKKTLVEKII